MNKRAFKQTQYDFAAHIRDPERHAAPDGIEDRRMAVYRELFYNNVEGFISSAYPVLRSLYSEENWHRLIRRYFSTHQAQTPHFPEMAEEFVNFLKDEFELTENDPPYMLELAHYEWMETAVMLSTDDINSVDANERGDLLEEPVVISPLAWLLYYQWPVHAISAEQRPESIPEEPTWIVIYRDRRDEVGFMQLNPVTARLIQLLDGDEALTGRQALEKIAQEMNHPQPEAIVQGGLDTLRQLRKKDIVLGTEQNN